MEKAYLRRREAAAYLGVHPQTLLNWDKAGILEATRYGAASQRRWSIQQLDIFKRAPSEIEVQEAPPIPAARLRYLLHLAMKGGNSGSFKKKPFSPDRKPNPRAFTSETAAQHKS